MTSSLDDVRPKPGLPWLSWSLRTMAIILVATPLAIVTWNILWLFIADPVHSWPKDEAARAAPMVEAIYAYRRDVGLWPQSIEELVPRYLAADQVIREPEWGYGWPGYVADVAPSFSTHGPFHIGLYYHFPEAGDVGGAGWEARWEGDPMRVEFPAIAPELLRPPVAAALQEQSLAELRDRIAREPDEPRHQKELARRMAELPR
ncbi:MAG: hypothetical protein WD066_13260 [Planctomycetaceae bacterium]